MESNGVAPHCRGRIRTVVDNLCPVWREKRPGVKHGLVCGSRLFKLKPSLLCGPPNLDAGAFQPTREVQK